MASQPQRSDRCITTDEKAGHKSRLNKSFAEYFLREQDVFAQAISGLSSEADRKRYATAVLQRILFLYFLQQNGCLDGNTHYLGVRLHAFQDGHRDDPSKTFYRHFLLALWHQGFDRSITCDTNLFGRLPEVAEAVWPPHPLEQAHPELNIPDHAFCRLFDFLDRYRWCWLPHAATDRSVVTPEVLGFLFEKSMDQRRLGAYYTEADVSGYIAQSTILPCFIEKLQQLPSQAFHFNGTWVRLLSADPDRYLFASLRHGVDLPLPSEHVGSIDGIELENKPAAPSHALATETWREYLERRQRCDKLRKHLRSISQFCIDDLVTHNLNLQLLAEDGINSSRRPDQLYSIYQTLTSLTILDTTCGAGAFLFAALDTLYPLYAACMKGMQAVTDVPAGQEAQWSRQALAEIHVLLDQVSHEANLDAYIVRTILRHNLFGIDLLEEAVELCRLRLLLRYMAARAAKTPGLSLPPLRDKVHKENILIDSRTAANLTGDQRTENDTYASPSFPSSTEATSVIWRGDFDVIIGNPPYVEYAGMNDPPTTQGYKTASCGNLYALVVERSLNLLTSQGRLGMIVPHSAFCTDRMEPLAELCTRDALSWISMYAIRPVKLFANVDQRLAISLIAPHRPQQTFSTRYHRWHDVFRPYLFEQLYYEDTNRMLYPCSVPKVGSGLEIGIWDKLHSFPKLQQDLIGEHSVFYHNAPRYWIRALTFAPYFWNERDGERVSTQIKTLPVRSTLEASAVAAVLNSSLFYWWFIVLSDCRHLNRREIDRFPLGLAAMTQARRQKLAALCTCLMDDYRCHAKRKECRYRTTGKVVYDEFYPRYSKHILDAIDRVLAEHYGLEDKELDFILHYDVKYRLGVNAEGA